MSDELRELLCTILDPAEQIALRTKTPVDDIIVRMLKSILNCKT